MYHKKTFTVLFNQTTLATVTAPNVQYILD